MRCLGHAERVRSWCKNAVFWAAKKKIKKKLQYVLHPARKNLEVVFSRRNIAPSNTRMKMFKVRISNSTLNSYGTRVLTEGLDTSQFERNPVLLYMHNRGQVIGCVRNIQKEGDDVVGELDFDEATDLSVQCRKQFEFGSLKAVSAGIDIVETSESPEFLLPGQTGPTITKSKLFEVSVVDVGANDDAIVLRHGGVRLTLGKDSENPLPLLTHTLNQSHHMELSKLITLLGLSAEATEADVETTLKTLLAERDTLQKNLETLQGTLLSQQLLQLQKEERINAEQKEKIINLSKDHSFEEVQSVIAIVAGDPTKETPKTQQFAHKDFGLTSILHKGSETQWKKLSEVPEAELATMRAEDREQYCRLYRAEYGFDPVF